MRYCRYFILQIRFGYSQRLFVIAYKHNRGGSGEEPIKEVGGGGGENIIDFDIINISKQGGRKCYIPHEPRNIHCHNMGRLATVCVYVHTSRGGAVH